MFFFGVFQGILAHFLHIIIVKSRFVSSCIRHFSHKHNDSKNPGSHTSTLGKTYVAPNFLNCSGLRVVSIVLSSPTSQPSDRVRAYLQVEIILSEPWQEARWWAARLLVGGPLRNVLTE